MWGGSGQGEADGGSRLEEKLLCFNMERAEWTEFSCSGSSGCWAARHGTLATPAATLRHNTSCTAGEAFETSVVLITMEK